MESTAKLEAIASGMSIEVAEELRPPPIQAFQRAPCGNTPVQLKQLFSSASSTVPDELDITRNSVGVHNALMPGGKRIALLKTMLTSACERDCFYCPFRAGRTMKRATFKPEEMAGIFMKMHIAQFATGMFLSSGIIGGGVRTQDKLLDTVDILRRKHEFHGYVHLKIMPGSERAQLERAMALADRVSINLEAPNQRRLDALAPKKNFDAELLPPLLWANEIRQANPHRKWASTVTQFVVGAAGETDVELLSTTERLHKQAGLSRAYYSAFSPVRDTPLENTAAQDPWREHRLYQSSYLLRDYGFDLEELPFGSSGNLPLEIDPKLAWAQLNLLGEPVEINGADRRALLRVPGIGPTGADNIMRARNNTTLRDIKDLRALGVLAIRAAPFITMAGRVIPQQMSLF